MSVEIGVAAFSLLLLCVYAIALVRRLRGVPRSRLLINLLFPASQACIVAFLLCYAIVHDLPGWMFFLVALMGVLCGPVDLALFGALREAEAREISRERVRLLEEQMQAQQAYLQRLSADSEEARRIRSDVAKKLSEVGEMLNRREADQARCGLLHAVDTMDSSRKRICGHRAVDALLSMKATLCREARIELALDVSLPGDVSLSSVEACAVFSNLMDNAMKACADVPEGKRFISMKARVEAGYLIVRMENSCLATFLPSRRSSARRGNGVPRHGWGLGILKALADRHEGTFEIAQDGDTFVTTIMLKASGSC